VDVNISDSNGITALHVVCFRTARHKSIQKILEHPDIDVNAEDKRDFTPLMDLCLTENMENEPSRQLLIRYPKLNIQYKNKYGMNVLMLCASSGLLESTMLVLENPEVRVDERDNDGRTALIHACLHGKDTVAKFLIQKGHADVNAVDHNGRSALEIACENNMEETIAELASSPFLRTPDWERLKLENSKPQKYKFINNESKPPWERVERAIREGMARARASRLIQTFLKTGEKRPKGFSQSSE